VIRSPARTLLFFAPAAAVPCAAFLATQYYAFGQFRPVYEEFGTKSYEYYGSYWTTPLEMDYFNKEPEPYGVYLFHMTLGHHGVFSLTPIFLFSMYGALRPMFGRGKRSRVLAWGTIGLSLVLLALTIWNPAQFQDLTIRVAKAARLEGRAQEALRLIWLLPIVLFLVYGSLRLLFASGERLSAVAGMGVRNGKNVPLLKSGGILVIDNIERYLPSTSHSPSARRAGESRWDSASWDAFAAEVANWRHIWTSNGVSDTALWVKP